MQVFKDKLSIDFMGRRYIAILLSVILMVLSIGSLVTQGLNFGIDFTGGTLIEVGYPEAVDLEEVRSSLSVSEFSQVQVQYFGTSRDVLLRIAPQAGREDAQLSDEVLAALRTQDAGVEMRRVEFVGPQVGEELTEQGGLAMIYALIGILIYIVVRFQWRFAPVSDFFLVYTDNYIADNFTIKNRSLVAKLTYWLNL